MEFEKFKNGKFELLIKNSEQKCLSQVDCQHRLGHMFDIEELIYDLCRIIHKRRNGGFNVINSKGLTQAYWIIIKSTEENLIQNKPELICDAIK